MRSIWPLPLHSASLDKLSLTANLNYPPTGPYPPVDIQTITPLSPRPVYLRRWRDQACQVRRRERSSGKLLQAFPSRCDRVTRWKKNANQYRFVSPFSIVQVASHTYAHLVCLPYTGASCLFTDEFFCLNWINRIWLPLVFPRIEGSPYCREVVLTLWSLSKPYLFNSSRSTRVRTQRLHLQPPRTNIKSHFIRSSSRWDVESRTSPSTYRRSFPCVHAPSLWQLQWSRPPSRLPTKPVP